MDTDNLRKADFKTGIMLIAFCLWFLSITFVFMPFKETYGGVENVWYVSPWIFPAVVLTLLLLLSVILTVNAVLRQGYRDFVEFQGAGPGSFKLTPVGTVMTFGLVVASGTGLWYLIANIEKKIEAGVEEAKWLADPSQAQIFSWTDPLAVVPLTLVSLVLIAALGVLVVSSRRRRLGTADRPSAFQAVRSSDMAVRFVIIAVLFCVLVYIFVPNVDFFVGTLLFLTVFMASFHVESPSVIRASMATYLAAGAGVLVLVVFGLDAPIKAAAKYAIDIVLLVLSIAYMIWLWRHLAGDAEGRRKYRTCLILSWATPLILVPVFRFGLLVPLPYEGAVVELMHQIRYLVF